MITRTSALLLRKVDYRESDVMVTLLTERLGKVSAVARAAKRSRTRFAGSLEPMHTLEVELSPSRIGDRLELRSARIERARLFLASDLNRMNAAARVLSWVRQAAPERAPEPLVHRIVERCLDRLDQPSFRAASILAIAGLELTSAFGWGLELDRCVSCGTPCPMSKAAYVSPRRGGLVCSACGRGEILLEPTRRAAIERALSGETNELGEDDAEVTLRIVEQALLSHADVGDKP